MASRSDEILIPEPIAFIDLKAQQARIRDRVEKRLIDVLDHGRYIGGPEIEELEALLTEKTGAATCVAVASGTDALVIPMMAAGLTRDDAVFIVFLYQRWCYPVDKTRANEFGIAYERPPDAALAAAPASEEEKTATSAPAPTPSSGEGD